MCACAFRCKVTNAQVARARAALSVHLAYTIMINTSTPNCSNSCRVTIFTHGQNLLRQHMHPHLAFSPRPSGGVVRTCKDVSSAPSAGGGSPQRFVRSSPSSALPSAYMLPPKPHISDCISHRIVNRLRVSCKWIARRTSRTGGAKQAGTCSFSRVKRGRDGETRDHSSPGERGLSQTPPAARQQALQSADGKMRLQQEHASNLPPRNVE